MSLRHRLVLSSRTDQRHDRLTEGRRRLSCHHPAVVSSFSACTSCQRRNVFRLIPPLASILSTTTLTNTPSHIERRLNIPTEHHRCRQERPSSSTTVVISSYPGSFMAKSRVNHLIHDYTDLYIHISLCRVCVDCEQRIDKRTHEPM